MTEIALEIAVDGMRQQRRDFTLTEISRRAIDLFVERGFDAVTVDEIAAAAGISPRTFYRYFPSKSDVLREHQRLLFERLTRALLARPPEEGAGVAMRKAFLSTAQMRVEDSARVVQIGRLLIGHDTTMPLARVNGSVAFEDAHISDLISVLEARGAIHDIELEATVGALLGAGNAAFRFWILHDGTTPLVDLMKQAFRLVKSGGKQ